MDKESGIYEEGAELAEEEAKRVDVGDVGGEPEEGTHDDVRDS